jgi:hypothetical protein
MAAENGGGVMAAFWRAVRFLFSAVGLFAPR